MRTCRRCVLHLCRWRRSSGGVRQEAHRLQARQHLPPRRQAPSIPVTESRGIVTPAGEPRRSAGPTAEGPLRAALATDLGNPAAVAKARDELTYIAMLRARGMG